MLKAIKKQRVVRILEEDAEKFKNLGYSIVTLDGKTLYSQVDPEEENDQLRRENALLKQRIAELQILLKDAPSPDSKDEDDDQ